MIGRRIGSFVVALAVLCACSHKPGPTVTAYLISEPAASVTLSFDPTAKVMAIALQGNGFVPNTPYQLELRRGTCLRPGRFLIAFGTITTDATGASHTQVKATHPTSGIPRGIHVDLRILVARSGVLAPETVSTACTDVPRKGSTSPIRLFPPPTLRSGGSFTATFKDARTLSLKISLVGLQPNSVHALRVYRGTCAAQGALDTSIEDLSADDAGSASATKVVHVSSKRGPMYVAVSAESSDLVEAAGKAIDRQIILCGDLPSRPS